VVSRATARLESASVKRRPTIGQAFGEVLRETRKPLEISQEILAYDSNMDRAYLSRLERGVTGPTLDTIFRLAPLLRTTPSAIVAAVEQKKPLLKPKEPRRDRKKPGTSGSIASPRNKRA
jgi:transcriptional regulator with XRE-family HTH domain